MGANFGIEPAATDVGDIGGFEGGKNLTWKFRDQRVGQGEVGQGICSKRGGRSARAKG